MASEIKKHTLNLTRGALYMLEGCLQDPGPCEKDYDKQTLWSRVWQRIRKSNDRMAATSWAPNGLDVEKPVLRGKDETDIEFNHRAAEWSTAMKTWEDIPISIAISDKYRDACRDAVKWVVEHQADGKTKFKISISPNWSLLLIELGLAKAAPTEDEDCAVLLADAPVLAAAAQH